MNIIRFAIDNPVKVAVGVILVALFGLLAIISLPIQLTPDVDRPFVVVETRWGGASPQEIESEIVDRQEEKLKGVADLKQMTSVSSQGSASVKLEFNVGVDKDAAFRDVSDKLRQVTGYPEEVDEPTVVATDDNMAGSIAWLILRSKTGEEVSHLKDFVEDHVKPILERADGVAEVTPFGGRESEMQIRVDAAKLAARGISFRDLENALRGQNRNISAGNVRQGKRDYVYRTVGEFRSAQDIEQTVITYRAGGPVLLRDVATVEKSFKRRTGFVRSKGESVIALRVKRETGKNVITAMENLQAQIKEVEATVLKPRGLFLDQTYDETVYINSAIGLVQSNILMGGLLAAVVLYLFLRSLSATGIIAVAIPISVVGTFLVIAMLGRPMNVIMMAGMAFAVGMVVDNAIVVLENIYRHRQMGKTQSQAAFDGAREVWGAILASTMTTMAVFLPVIFIEEEAGQLFRDIAIAISAAVALSLIVSIFVIPSLASRKLRASKRLSESANADWFVARGLSNVVRRLNTSTAARMALVLLLMAASIGGSVWLAPEADYLPAGNQNLCFGMILSPPGYSVDEFDFIAKLVEDGDPENLYDGARPAWEAELGSPEAAKIPPVSMKASRDGSIPQEVVPPPIENFFFVAFQGGSFMGATSKDPAVVSPIAKYMSVAAGRVPGVFSFVNQRSLFGGDSGTSVEVQISGQNLDRVVPVASAMVGAVMGQGFDYPRPEPSNFDLGRPEVRIIPDRERAADLGLDVRTIGFAVEAFVDGAFVGEYNDFGDKIDLTVLVEGTEEKSPTEIAQLPIFTPAGKVVPLSSVIQISRTTAPQQINHTEVLPSVTLTVKPLSGQPVQNVMTILENDIIEPMRKSGQIDDSIIIRMAGTADKLTTTMNALVGDFSGTVTRPSVFGRGVFISICIVAVAAALLVLLIGLMFGARRTVPFGKWLGAGLLVTFLALNPEFAYNAVQSRAILALVITYLLMAALFESFVYPFVIMLSVPLAMVGGFGALRIIHELTARDPTTPVQNLDVLTMLGFVILVGVVVNNAILIVHQTLTNMRESGEAPADAIVSAVRARTRPIFMSALTSVFGMIPLVIMTGPGSELYKGIGSVVTGGLLVSTVFTLFVVPAMLSLFLDARIWLERATVAQVAGKQAVPAEPIPQPSSLSNSESFPRTSGGSS